MAGPTRISYPFGTLNNAGSGTERLTSDNSVINFPSARIVHSMAHDDPEIGGYPKLTRPGGFAVIAVSVGWNHQRVSIAEDRYAVDRGRWQPLYGAET